jgi:hypothetical protein
MCTQFLHHIHPSTTFLRHLPLHTGANPSSKTCSALLFSDFVEEKRRKKKKKMTFLLVIKVTTQEVLL